ncbi:MAG: CmpA/NrtA family ABC transporter substrate-binding protein [Porticoccaceae bacterium]
MNSKNLEKLPPSERSDLNLGYMRLSDSAPFIVAQELGFYEKYGLNISLHREVSWANIRDKMITGAFDACQMLAPMVLATTLGAAGIRAPIINGLVLSLNGNAITLSAFLWDKMTAKKPIENFESEETAKALKSVIENSSEGPLTFATVHNFSTHTLLLRKWFDLGGIDPDRDVRIIVLPPEQMVDSLAQGVIDGFCVGEPWNSIAVEYGAGVMATTGVKVWNGAPEKVLAVSEAWHVRNPASHLRLRLALMESCSWLSDMNNRKRAIEILSLPYYLDLSKEYLRPSLAGQIFHQRTQPAFEQTDFHVFDHLNAGFPWRSDAEAMISQFAPLIGKPVSKESSRSLVQRCCRTDLYREAAQLLGIEYPAADYRA